MNQEGFIDYSRPWGELICLGNSLEYQLYPKPRDAVTGRCNQYLLGRSPDSIIKVKCSQFLSSKHCTIYCTEQRVVSGHPSSSSSSSSSSFFKDIEIWIEDTSTNGTFMIQYSIGNDEPMRLAKQIPYQVRNNDVIYLINPSFCDQTLSEQENNMIIWNHAFRLHIIPPPELRSDTTSFMGIITPQIRSVSTPQVSACDEPIFVDRDQGMNDNCRSNELLAFFRNGGFIRRDIDKLVDACLFQFSSPSSRLDSPEKIYAALCDGRITSARLGHLGLNIDITEIEVCLYRALTRYEFKTKMLVLLLETPWIYDEFRFLEWLGSALFDELRLICSEFMLSRVSIRPTLESDQDLFTTDGSVCGLATLQLPIHLYRDRFSDKLRSKVNDAGYMYYKLLMSSNDSARIERLRFTKHVCPGSFGVICQVLDGTEVKALKIHHIITKASKDEFVRDLTTLSKLGHKSSRICKISANHDGTDSTFGWFVMEFCQGSLADSIASTTTSVLIKSPKTFWKWSCQIAEGLEHIHSEGIIHCDLTPANILLSRNGNCKIAGFGLSRPSTASIVSNTDSICQRGILEYISPELRAIAGTIQLSFKYDIWAIGVIMSKLSTNGQANFEDISCSETNLIDMVIEPLKIIANVPTLRKDIEALKVNLGACLRMDPGNRRSARTIRGYIQKTFPIKTVQELEHELTSMGLGKLDYHPDIKDLKGQIELLKETALTDGNQQWSREQCESAENVAQVVKSVILSQLDKARSLYRTNQGTFHDFKDLIQDEESRYSTVLRTIFEQLIMYKDRRKLEELNGALKIYFNKERPLQLVDDLGTLYNHAMQVKPTFDAMIKFVVSRVPGPKARVVGLKELLRVCEKMTLEVDLTKRTDQTEMSNQTQFKQIFDITRGMILCDNVSEIRQIIDVIVSLDPSLQSCLPLSSPCLGEVSLERMVVPPMVASGLNRNLSAPIDLISPMDIASAPPPPRSINKNDVTVFISQDMVVAVIPPEYRIRILRVKPRMGPPHDYSMLGDCLINLCMVGDENMHICELQIVHTHTHTARNGLGGHKSYSWIRSAHQLLNFAMQDCEQT